jgi:hypothetical protein
MLRLFRLRQSGRTLATLSDSRINQSYLVFDRNAKRLQRDRAAGKNDGAEHRMVDYLRNEVAERMIERLLVRLYFIQSRAIHELQ